MWHCLYLIIWQPWKQIWWLVITLSEILHGEVLTVWKLLPHIGAMTQNTAKVLCIMTDRMFKVQWTTMQGTAKIAGVAQMDKIKPHIWPNTAQVGLNFLSIQSLLPTFWNSKQENHGSPRLRDHEIYKKIFVFALPIPGVFNLRLYKSKDCHNTYLYSLNEEKTEKREFLCAFLIERVALTLLNFMTSILTIFILQYFRSLIRPTAINPSFCVIANIGLKKIHFLSFPGIIIWNVLNIINCFDTPLTLFIRYTSAVHFF